MSPPHTLTMLREARASEAEVPLCDIEIVTGHCDPAEPDVGDPRGAGLLTLVEMILKAPLRLDRHARRGVFQPALIPRFLTISLLSFTLFGVALSVVLASARVLPRLTPIDEYLDHKSNGMSLVEFEAISHSAEFWTSGSAWQLIAAYCFGLIAATGVCLPSLYFYGLLSGIRLTMLDVTTFAMKAKATTAVALMGILPIYIAVALGVMVFDWMPALFRDWAIWLGLVLPFIAGLFGTRALYRGFEGLTDTLPADRCERRGCFLRRLVVSWAACYTAVSPVMIYVVWEKLQ